MLRSQRLREIVRLVASQGTVTVDQLVSTLEVSPATARRDLDLLAQQGQILRTRGGASTVFGGGASQTSTNTHQAEKQAIAKACRQFLQPGATIGLSGGSTVLELAKVIVQWVTEKTPPQPANTSPILTVVTNAMNVAQELTRSASIKIIILGGELNKASLEITGPSSLAMLKKFWCDIAFIGVNGFDEYGPGTADEYESHTNQAMINQSTLPIIVTDSSKFGKSSFSTLNNARSIRTVVTDSGISEEVQQALRSQNYDIVIAEPEEA